MKKLSKSFKIIILLILILSLSTSYVFAGELTNFLSVQVYSSNFEDVKNTDWFYKDVINSYKAGLFIGKAEDTFDPNGNITLAEAITIISRVHNIYNGGTGIIKEDGSKVWYSKYINYAINNGLIEKDEFINYDAKATRAEIAYLFYNSIDLKEFTMINTITSLPDVNRNTKYKDEIFTLYNSGIFTGSDKYGTFKPSTFISRAETSAVINRIINKNNRLKINLVLDNNIVKIKDIDGYKITSLSEIGEYLAIEMVKGNKNINIKQFNLFSKDSSDTEITVRLKDLIGEVLYQNPMIFGIEDSFSYNLTEGILSVEYTHDRYNQEQLQSYVTARAKEIVSSIIKSDMTYAESIIAINNYLSDNIEYDTAAADYFLQTGTIKSDSINSFNVYGAFNKSLAVCGGYAQAFKVLCDEAGITSIVVSGDLNGVGHEWNRVLINGKWYDVDVTNNDKEDLINTVLNLPLQIANKYLTETDYYITKENLHSLDRGTSLDYEYYNYKDKYLEEDEIYNYILKNINTNSVINFRTNSEYTLNDLEQVLSKILNNINIKASISYSTYLGVVYIEIVK